MKKSDETSIFAASNPMEISIFPSKSPGFCEVLGALLRGEKPELVAKFVATRMQLEVPQMWGFIGILVGHHQIWD